ncbi:hypothetical protein MTP99_000094 [Tenebrio molitor]|nr:hypothetical protein MTP99_000094 [Tenebrio molitor]
MFSSPVGKIQPSSLVNPTLCMRRGFFVASEITRTLISSGKHWFQERLMFGYRKVEALHLEQANTDFFSLCELLKDYLGLLGSVRDAFHERTKLFQHWQHSQQMLTKKPEAKTKMELTNRSNKEDQVGAEVIEVTSGEIRKVSDSRLQDDVYQISGESSKPSSAAREPFLPQASLASRTDIPIGDSQNFNVYVSIYVILWSCRKQRAPQLSSGEVIRLFNKVGVTVNKMDETDPKRIEPPDQRGLAFGGHVERLRGPQLIVHGAVTLRPSPIPSKLCTWNKPTPISSSWSLRDAFHERTTLFQHWQHSQQMLAKKCEAKAKMELTNRSDKEDQISAEVIEKQKSNGPGKFRLNRKNYQDGSGVIRNVSHSLLQDDVYQISGESSKPASAVFLPQAKAVA